MCANERQQAFLAVTTLCAGLREARRDHAERPDITVKRAFRGLDDLFCGQADHGEVDCGVDLGDGSVGAHAGNGLRFQVHGIRRAGEVRRQNVAKELAADRAAPARSTHDGERARAEERSQRVDDGDVVPLRDTTFVVVRRGDREAQFDLVPVLRARHLESRVAEDRERCRVRCENIRDKPGDSLPACRTRQLLQQASPYSASLFVVGDSEGHLGSSRLTRSRIASKRDDSLAAILGQRGHKSPSVAPVRVEKGPNRTQVE